MKEKCTSCGISTDFDTTSDINYRSYLFKEKKFNLYTSNFPEVFYFENFEFIFRKVNFNILHNLKFLASF